MPNRHCLYKFPPKVSKFFFSECLSLQSSVLIDVIISTSILIRKSIEYLVSKVPDIHQIEIKLLGQALEILKIAYVSINQKHTN